MMKKSITKLIVSCVLIGGFLVPTSAQLQSKIDFTLEQKVQIETLTKEYEKQGLDFKQACMKAEEEVAPEVVKLRIKESPWLYPNHAAWLASTPHPGSIHVDRDATIHGYTPEELVKKILLKAYTPEDEDRIENVRFKGWQGVSGGGNGWFDTNSAIQTYGEGNRGLAYFTRGSSNFDIDRGLLISTGHTWGHEGPNQSATAFNEGVGYDGVTTSTSQTFDIDIKDNVILSTATYGGLLEFDFCPADDKATFDYIFGSEEYPEFSNTQYNDGFGFFVSGPYEAASESASEGQNQTSGYTSTTSVSGITLPARNSRGVAAYNGEDYATYYQYNIAQLPNGDPVSVNWTNWGYRAASNTAAMWSSSPVDTVGVGALLVPGRNIYDSDPAYPIHNSYPMGTTRHPLAMNPEYHRAIFANSDMMELDGITVKLTAIADSLIPGKWYHLKLVICQKDVNHGDGVFIGNLDLGQGTSGIDAEHGWDGWPSSNDLSGLHKFYAGCSQTLMASFTPYYRSQVIEIIPMGAAAGNVVASDGSELVLLDTIPAGEEDIVRSFKIKDDPSFENGAEGYFIMVAYDPLNLLYEVRDTTDVYKFYKRFTTDVVYRRPSPGYAGRLDLNIQDGSPDMWRSVNKGHSWENAHIPLAKYQIANLAEDEDPFIILGEPNSCWKDTIYIGSGIVDPGIQRPVYIPEVSNAVLDYEPGEHFITSREHFVFTITPTGPNAGMTPVVTTDRTTIPDSEGVKVEPNGDGSFTVTIYRVQEPIHISIDFATSNAAIEDGSKVWSGNGQVYIISAAAGDATIYNASGMLIHMVICTAGETNAIDLPAGFYIVRLSNGNSYKVSVK